MLFTTIARKVLLKDFLNKTEVIFRVNQESLLKCQAVLQKKCVKYWIIKKHFPIHGVFFYLGLYESG